MTTQFLHPLDDLARWGTLPLPFFSLTIQIKERQNKLFCTKEKKERKRVTTATTAQLGRNYPTSVAAKKSITA